jgi:hypothetical protein
MAFLEQVLWPGRGLKMARETKAAIEGMTTVFKFSEAADDKPGNVAQAKLSKVVASIIAACKATASPFKVGPLC